MSAGAVGVLAPEPVLVPSLLVPSRTQDPPLRLVTADGELSPVARPGPDGTGVAAPVPALRFTRRGRLVITLMAAVVVAVLAVVLAASVDAAAPQIDHATIVSARQTLSEVAAAQLPGLRIQEAVALIQLANGLNTSQVQAGQSLLIPAMP